MEEFKTVKISQDVWRMLKLVSVSGISIQAYASDALREAIRRDFPEVYRSSLRTPEWLAQRTKVRSLSDLYPLSDDILPHDLDAAPSPQPEPPAPAARPRRAKRA